MCVCVCVCVCLCVLCVYLCNMQMYISDSMLYCVNDKQENFVVKGVYFLLNKFRYIA